MRATVLLMALTVSTVAFAQHLHPAQASDYAGMQTRDIKALSQEQVADLREGKGMGASLPAELNGVPGPLHVLQMEARLNVTSDQRLQLGRIAADMETQAQLLGEGIVAAEASLDAAFKSGKVDETFIRTTTARIAELQGQLRAVHLMAHLKTRQVLSDQQVVAYNEARGYAAQPGAHQHAH